MAIAIIGAGMAGLSAAHELAFAGFEVHLFDKGRGPGGRMSTRRADVNGQQVRFDHGAQYLIAKTKEFQATLDGWVAKGVADKWLATVAEIDPAGAVSTVPAQDRYVGVPGMNDIIRYLASDLNVTWGARVSHLVRTDGHWHLAFEDSREGQDFESVIIAVPAEQVSPLLIKETSIIKAAATKIESTPCWTTLLAFEDAVPVAWQAATSAHSILGWVSSNRSKPGREGIETWVLQASPDWSKAHLEDEKERVVQAMSEAFRRLTSAGEPIFSTAHRWRYSQVHSPAPQLCYWSAEDQIGACGDWCAGPTVEDAWRSGRTLAAKLIAL